MGPRIHVTVLAHQLLHGYVDGHRLLAASTELPPPAMRELLIHSDAAPGPREEMALSSLPLPQHGKWALTATWRAGEVSRSGSVWSHTLLLDTQAIGKLRYAGGLLKALQRPAGLRDAPRFREPLAIPDRPVWSDESSLDQVLEAVLMALYRWPDQPGSVVVASLPRGERALLAVWEQQWPELRASFAFTARSRLENDGKDAVQVATMAARSRAATAVIDVSRPLPERLPDWVGRMSADVARPGDLRAFLLAYGPQGHGRRDVRLLVELEDGFKSETPSRAFERLVEAYPAPEEMSMLKQAVLARNSTLWPGPDEQRLVVAYEHQSRVEWASLMLGDRVANLWPTNADALAVCLRLASESNEDLRTDTWIAVSQRADEAMLIHLADTDVELAIELVLLRPDLLLRPLVWKLKQAWQEPLVAGVAGRGAAVDPALAQLLIAEGNIELASALWTRSLLEGRDVAAAIAGGGLSPTTWRSYKKVFGRAKDEAVQAALRVDASWVERMLAALLPGSRNPVVKEFPDQLAEHLSELDGPAQKELATRLLAAKRGKPASKAVMQAAFPVLHRAMVSESLSDRQWAQLDKALPPGNHWDRAERLRKALLESIKHQHWSDQEVAHVIEAAGPEADKIRRLTDKKSDLRKALDAAWELVTPWW